MRICLVATMALLLSACGGKPEQGAAPAKRAARASVPAVVTDDAVAAVLESQGMPVAQLRFVIDSRPVAGQPFGLRLLLSASAPVPQLLVTMESDGLTVDPARVPLALGEATDGSGHQYSASHDFSLTGAQPGLVELTVHLVADVDATETLYVIPVLLAKPGAAAGAAAPASNKPDPAAKDDHAEPKKG